VKESEETANKSEGTARGQRRDSEGKRRDSQGTATRQRRVAKEQRRDSEGTTKRQRSDSGPLRREPMSPSTRGPIIWEDSWASGIPNLLAARSRTHGPAHRPQHARLSWCWWWWWWWENVSFLSAMCFAHCLLAVKNDKPYEKKGRASEASEARSRARARALARAWSRTLLTRRWVPETLRPCSREFFFRGTITPRAPLGPRGRAPAVEVSGFQETNGEQAMCEMKRARARDLDRENARPRDPRGARGVMVPKHLFPPARFARS
jgi:hypothetical protein